MADQQISSPITVKQSLQTNFLRVLLPPLVIISTLIIIISGVWYYQHEIEQLADANKRTARTYALMIAGVVWQFDRSSLELIAQRIGQQKNVSMVEIVDERKNLLANYNANRSNEEPLGISHMRIKENIYHLDRNGEQKLVGHLDIVFNNESLRARLIAQLGLLALLMTTLVIVIVMGVISVFRRMIRNPLVIILDAISRARQSDQLELIHYNSADEFGVFTNEYNALRREIVANANRLQTVYNRTPGLMCAVDQNAAIVSASTFFCQAIDAERKQLIGRPFLELFPDSANNEMLQKLKQSLFNGESITGLQMMLRNTEASVSISVLVNTVPDFDGEGNALGSLCIMADVSEQIKARKELEYQANHDLLTSLPNRYYLMQQLEKELTIAKEQGHSLAAIFIDLDRFKSINDAHTHDIGDRILIETSRRIESAIDQNGQVCRLGGDEFIILIPLLKKNQSLEPMLHKLLAKLRAPYKFGRYSIRSSASAGVALYPDNADTGERLLTHADLAMYRAKSERGNGYAYYSEKLDQISKNKVSIVDELTRAYEDDRFELFLQPIIGFQSSGSAIVGYESLHRLRPPQSGEFKGMLLSPGEYIPIAEEFGLILVIGDWMLRQAVSLLANWEDGTGGLPEPDYISVNVSPLQLEANSFLPNLATLLDESGVERHRLMLEITESAAISMTSNRPSAVKELQNFGCPLALDDFGTGYSSLSTLHSLNFDVVKIDNTFAHSAFKDPKAATLLSAILAMTEALNLRTVVEGIESQEQESHLRSLIGLRKTEIMVQGFHYGKPRRPREPIVSVIRNKAKAV